MNAIEVTYKKKNGKWVPVTREYSMLVLPGDPGFYIDKPPPHKEMKEKMNGNICYIGKGYLILPVNFDEMDAYLENDMEWGVKKQDEWLNEKYAMDKTK